MKGTHPCADHGLASAAALTLASVPAVALAVPQDEASQNEASPITLDLYNLTDVHGHIQQVAKKGVVREAGLPAMNCYLKKARATYTVGSVTFLLAGGDSFEALTRGEHPRRTEIWTAILSTPTWARTRVRRPTRARRLTQRVTPNPATRRRRLRSTRTRSLPRTPWPARVRTRRAWSERCLSQRSVVLGWSPVTAPIVTKARTSSP